jgi:chaperonin cofactor prefoldin
LRPKSKEELNAELCGDAEQIVARVENYSCSEEDAARRAAELEEVFRSVEE